MTLLHYTIGLAIVRNLALQYPKSSLNTGPLPIYLTARSLTRGEEVVKTLLADPHLKAAKALTQDGGLTTITFGHLDITDETSIRDFKHFVNKEHPDGIDILVNNAGIYMDASDVNMVKTLLKTNYYGTLAIMKEFPPLIRPKGRLVNVASMDGQLELYSEPLKRAFIEASKTSTEACTVLMEKFTADLETGKGEAEGWPIVGYAYCISKAGEIAATKAAAAESAKSGGEILINACCPGFVNMDMTRGHGTMTVDEGAKTPVLLALGNIGEATGEF